MERSAVLKANEAIRRGNAPKPRRLDCGETALRIPEADFVALRRLYPELASLDGKTRFEAWQRFSRSPFAEPYRVMPSVRQVRNQTKGVIIR